VENMAASGDIEHYTFCFVPMALVEDKQEDFLVERRAWEDRLLNQIDSRR
jgi:hypothetical protein